MQNTLLHTTASSVNKEKKESYSQRKKDNLIFRNLYCIVQDTISYAQR